MRFKFLSIFAVALLVAACETTPEETADTSGSGETMAQVAPPPPDTPLQEDLLLNVGDRIFFDFDRSDLKSDAQDTLQRLAAWMNGKSNVTITLEGHADERGTREYNLALGERRANSARDFLIALGVDAGRLTTISYGKERPAVLGSNEDSWAQNRRDVFVVN